MFKVDEATAEIYVYDMLGPEEWGFISDGMVVDALNKLKGRETIVRINSDGGSVTMGTSIANAIERHGDVICQVDGIAASAAGYFPMKAKRVVMASNSTMMHHKPWMFTAGNDDELIAAAEVLRTMTRAWLGDYVAKSGKSENEMIEILSSDSYFTAQEAIDSGFADEIGNTVVSDTEIASALHEIKTGNNAKKKLEAAAKRQPRPLAVAASIRARQNRIKNRI